MTKARDERRWWALDMAAGLLHTDLDTMDFDTEFDEDETIKRKQAIREIADDLQRRADKIQRRLNQ